MTEYPEMLHPEIETMSPTATRALQDQRWQQQLSYLIRSSCFYQRKYGNKLNDDLTLDALQDLDLTDKEELRQSQELAPPFGDYVACSDDKVARLHRTSGTTGRALILANSLADADIIAEQGARGVWASGLRPNDRVVHCLNYQMWTGGVTDHMTFEKLGATVLPYGTGGSKQLLRVIKELGINAISCTPSYPALLETLLEDDPTTDPRDLGLRIALFGGEAGLDNQAFRDELESTWGFKVRNSNYGLSEVMSTMGSQSEHSNDLHFLSQDVVFFELLDTETGQRLPVEDGATGEMVCTHLRKECQPLIRYRTRDVLTITNAGTSACGRTMFQFRVTGRTDDMFNVRGVNVFPTAVAGVIAESTDISSGHYRIVLEGPGPYDRIKLRVEAKKSLDSGDWDGAARELERRSREKLGASAEVEIVGFSTLPRTDGKTSLIERV